MAAAPRAKRKGVQPGGPMIRAAKGGKAKSRKPAPRRTVNPGGPMIAAGHAPKAPPAPAHPAKKTAVKRKTARRGLGAVPCCVAEALAASLRLTGWRVTDVDVLALHARAAGDFAQYAWIEDVLEAASVYGLAGAQLLDFGPAELDDGGHLLLGVDVPGPHTVLDDGSSWWSWGQPFEPFAGAVVSEAWAITWGSA